MRLPRVYPIVDTGALAKCNCSATTAAAAMIAGGAGMLQLRHKGHWPRAVFEEAERIAGWCHQEGVLLIVNDRADMAMLLDAGLHVGQGDLPPSDARLLIGPEAVLGFSTHNTRQLAAAGGEPVTYVAIGPIFGTTSKENPDPKVGLDQLRACRALTDQPLVAIGGITRRNARSVFEAGADSVAILGDLLPENCTHESLRERMEEWQQFAGK